MLQEIGLMQNKVDDRYMESLCDYRVSGFSENLLTNMSYYIGPVAC